MVLIREERTRFQAELAKIEGIRVIPSQANYIMVELINGIDSKDLVKSLLIRHNILVKELTGKTEGRNYLRIAVRNTEDNDRILSALCEEMKAGCSH